MPDTLPEFHIYSLLTPDGFATGIKRKVEYIYKDNEYIVNEINGTYQNVMSTTLRHVKFSNHQVLVTYSKKKNSLGMTEVKRFNPPAILLEIPKGNETVGWVNKETGEKYTARYVIINEGGEGGLPKKYLATYRRDGNVIEAQYYKLGFGLWKTAMIKNGASTTLYRLGY